MDALGERIVRDKQEIKSLREAADLMEKEVQRMRREADEIERLMELARMPNAQR